VVAQAATRSALSSAVIPSAARNLALVCEGRAQSEIPRCARNDTRTFYAFSSVAYCAMNFFCP
jgi:hypothetical protein